MNYIKQLNAFKSYLAFNDLPSVAILLWHTLMLINNMTGWKRRFNASGALIQQYSGLSKQRLFDGRKALVEHGLIHYEKGHKGRAPVYEMVILDDAFLYGDSIEKVVPEVEEITSIDINQIKSPGIPDLFSDPYPDLSTDESRNILKHKQKQKRRRGKAHPAFHFYEQNLGSLKPAVCNIIDIWCDVFSDELVLEAMHVAVMNGGKTLKYIEKTLTTWSDAGLKTVEAIRMSQEEKNKKGKQTDAKTKSIFDELREELLA